MPRTLASARRARARVAKLQPKAVRMNAGSAAKLLTRRHASDDDEHVIDMSVLPESQVLRVNIVCTACRGWQAFLLGVHGPIGMPRIRRNDTVAELASMLARVIPTKWHGANTTYKFVISGDPSGQMVEALRAKVIGGYEFNVE